MAGMRKLEAVFSGGSSRPRMLDKVVRVKDSDPGDGRGVEMVQVPVMGAPLVWDSRLVLRD